MTTCQRKRITSVAPPPLQTILDQSGAKSTQCCLLRNGLLVVAREEGLYDYTLDTRYDQAYQLEPCALRQEITLRVPYHVSEWLTLSLEFEGLDALSLRARSSSWPS